MLSANAAIGVWLVYGGVLALVSSSLPGGLAWVMLVAGIGLVLINFGFWIGGQSHPLVSTGGVVALLANLIWAIWLGRLLLSGRVTLPG